MDRDQGNNDSAGSAAPDDVDSLFGFDLPPDNWISRVRRAIDTPEETLDTHEVNAQPGQRVGSYELIEIVGTGGMGTVWRARRADRQFQRDVAIKLVARNAWRAESLHRFRMEGQALASLAHPNIAQLFDAGKMSDGQPFLVMELVNGTPITQFASTHDLSVRERINLFIAVGRAVHAAHANLILHRDIKPTNVLVSEDGTPKLLDFGIAKLLDDTGAERTGITQTDARVLTPRYASPEQIRGGKLTTATDVYSLGIVLYELLTERPAYEVESESRIAMERCVLDQEPIRPSTSVLRRSDLLPAHRRRLSRQLRGDLNTIVATAICKDARERYRSAEQLADDLQRHIDGRTISVSPESAVVALRKFARRNRGLVYFGAFATIVLIVATGVSTAFALREAQARREAERRTRVAESITTFLNKDMLAAVDPENTDNPDLTMREVLDRAARELEGKFAGEPLVEASIRRSIGETYKGLGLPGSAVTQLETAVSLYQHVLGTEHKDTRNAMRSLLGAMTEGERGDEVRPLAEKLLAIDVRLDGSESATAMMTRQLLARLYPQSEYLRTIAEFERVLAWQRANLGERAQSTLSTMMLLSNMYLFHDMIDKADPLVMELWTSSSELFGEAHPRTLKAMSAVALLHTKKGRSEKAVAVLEESVRIHRETKPANFYGTGIMLGHLGQARMAAQRYDEAEAAFLEAYEILSASLGPRAGWTGSVARLLVTFYEETGDTERATTWRKRIPQRANEEPSD